MEITHLGSGIWSYSRRRTGAIFLVTVPATIMRSDWRGEARKTSAPKRAMSYREADAAIISIAQHARPNPIGQIDDSRAQFRTRSMLVVMKLSSKRWSMSPIGDPYRDSGFGIRVESQSLPPAGVIPRVPRDERFPLCRRFVERENGFHR